VIKFLQKFGNSISEKHKVLKSKYGSGSPSYSTVSRWYKYFSNGRTELVDNPRPGRPKSGQTDTKVKKVSAVLDKDRRHTVREICDRVRLPFGTVYRIITVVLGLVLKYAR